MLHQLGAGKMTTPGVIAIGTVILMMMGIIMRRMMNWMADIVATTITFGLRITVMIGGTMVMMVLMTRIATMVIMIRMMTIILCMATVRVVKEMIKKRRGSMAINMKRKTRCFGS